MAAALGGLPEALQAAGAYLAHPLARYRDAGSYLAALRDDRASLAEREDDPVWHYLPFVTTPLRPTHAVTRLLMIIQKTGRGTLLNCRNAASQWTAVAHDRPEPTHQQLVLDPRTSEQFRVIMST